MKLMFALRGAAVFFSVFAVVYGALSLAVCLGWSRIRVWARDLSANRLSDLLFSVRMLPFAAAAVITGVFIVPSFLLFEPRTINESLSAAPAALGFVGAGICLMGLGNALSALRKASRTISSWVANAQLILSPSGLPFLRIAQPIPPMIAVGILRSRILLSTSAEFVLGANELETAIHHEMAHVRRRDNLRKLLLRLVAFPGMQGLEAAWIEAAEMAADDAAVSSSGDALDLAAALIKLSRLTASEPTPYLTAALVRVPAAIMNARVERLLAWTPECKAAPRGFSRWYSIGFACATLITLVQTYRELLVRIHTATEWFVR
jgi:Zn-dependent protease with chaperone function